MFVTNQEAIDDRTMKIERPDVKGSGYIAFPPQKPFSENIVAQPPTVSHEALPEYYTNAPGVGGRGAQAQQGRGQAGRGMAGRGQPAATPQPRAATQMHAPAAAPVRGPSQYGAPQGGYVPQQHATGLRPATSGYSGMAGRGGMPAGRVPGRGQQQGQAPYDSRESHRPATNGYQGQGGGMHAPTHQAAQQPVAAAPGRGGYAPQGRGAGRTAAPAGHGGYAPRPAGAAGPGAAAAGRGRGLAGGRHGYAAVGPAAVAAAALPPRPAAHAPARPAPVAAAVGGSDSGDDSENTGVMSRSQLKRLRKKKREGKS